MAICGPSGVVRVPDREPGTRRYEGQRCDREPRYPPKSSGRCARCGGLHVVGARSVESLAEQVGDGCGLADLPVEAELPVRIGEVPLDRPDAEGERIGDLVVRVPFGREPQHLDLARRKGFGWRLWRGSADVWRSGSRNAVTSSQEDLPGGLVGSRMWLLLSRATSRASGICAATSGAFSNVVMWSPTAWSTRVGAVMRPSSSPRSTACRAMRLATAFSGDVDMRWRASNHAIWSSVASGMNMLVKTRRKRGSSSPSRPGSCSAACPPRPAIGSAHGGMPHDRAVQHEPTDVLGLARRVGHRYRRAAGHAEQRESLQSECPDHASRSPTLASRLKSSTAQSDIPKPRSS